MAKTLAPDYSNIIDILDKFSGRIDEVAKESKRTYMSIEMSSLEWHSTISKANREISLLKAQLKDMKDRTKRLKENFVDVVMNFRTKSDREEFEKLRRKADSFRFEEYMSKDEFSRLIRNNSP